MNKIWDDVEWWIGSQGDLVRKYLREDSLLVAVLLVVAIAAYGFELFNFNVTIDEEIHAFSSQAYTWIVQGRRGLFF